MSSKDVVDPVCPRNYTLQKDRLKYRLCKCIKNKNVPEYYDYSDDDYKKVKRRVTVKRQGRQNRCPSGTRYNKKTGYCEGKTKNGRSLMSVLFKDGESRNIKTKRKTVKARVEKKRPKCPDGYVINHEIGLCERRGLKKYRKTSDRIQVSKAKTAKRRKQTGDSYYETVYPQSQRRQTVKPVTMKLRSALKKPQVRPRYSFRNTVNPVKKEKKVRLVEPTQRVATQKPEYISLSDYLARNKQSKNLTAPKQTYRKTPARTAEKKKPLL